MIDHYCTYMTIHPSTGKYYIGKGVTTAVERGYYKGSGVILKCAFQKYPKDEWVTKVLWKFDTSDEAFSDEAQLIEEHLGQPGCLNLTPGGKGGRGKYTAEQLDDHKRALNTPAALAKKSLASKASAKSPGRVKQLEDMQAAFTTERRSSSMSASWSKRKALPQTEEEKVKALEAKREQLQRAWTTRRANKALNED